MNLLALLVALLPISALADVEASLGKSPDGRFELVLTASSEKDYGRVIVRDLKTGTSTETDSGQGYGYFPSGDVEAAWKHSSDAFAVTMRGTKRTWNTDVYIREGDTWEKLQFPPHVANILGRQGVFEGGRSFHESFGGFERDNHFILFSTIEPDWQQQEEAAKETTWKPTTQTDWTIVLEYHYRTRPNCRIISIKPTEEGQTNKAVDSTATRVTPPAEQEPRHGQP